MENLPKMGGENKNVQIDESVFHGKRKYNRGKLFIPPWNK